jgi:predicted  nucleic acid-binding Zn-ribbon protein
MLLPGLLCVCIVIIAFLNKKIDEMKSQFETDLLAEKNRAKKEVEEAQQYAEQQIKKYKAHIETRREALMQKDEKTLIVDAILRLGTLGEQIVSLREDVELVVTRQLKYCDEIISSAETMRVVKNEIDAIKTDVDTIKSEVNSIYWSNIDIKSKIDSVQSTADYIKSETNSIYYKVGG